MATKKPENEEEKASRMLLQQLLRRAQGFLRSVSGLITSEESRLPQLVRNNIATLSHDSDTKLNLAYQWLENGASKRRRNALQAAGLFGGELEAKFNLFEFCLTEKRFPNALKLLASIFGSLSKIFPMLSAVKEFIDAVLCVRDWLPDPELSDLATLGDLR